MKASSALTQPGDAARRESDGAVAVWMYEFGSDPVKIKVMAPHVQTWWTPGQDIPGDDWQPLHPAGELEAEVKRLTAERDELSTVVFECMEAVAGGGDMVCNTDEVGRRVAGHINALTARVSELERFQDDTPADQKWVATFFDSPLSSESSYRNDYLKWLIRFERFQLLDHPMPCLKTRGQVRMLCRSLGIREDTAPLPTAGEGDRVIVTEYVCLRCRSRVSEDAPCPHCTKGMFAPAEPDSPAEERIKLPNRDVAYKALMARSKQIQGEQGDDPRKPDCLANVPAVLCDAEGLSVWAAGHVVDGRVPIYWLNDDGDLYDEIAVAAELTPIHHDPTDAAAEALRGEIEGGGAR